MKVALARWRPLATNAAFDPGTGFRDRRSIFASHLDGDWLRRRLPGVLIAEKLGVSCAYPEQHMRVLIAANGRGQTDQAMDMYSSTTTRSAAVRRVNSGKG